MHFVDWKGFQFRLKFHLRVCSLPWYYTLTINQHGSGSTLAPNLTLCVDEMARGRPCTALALRSQRRAPSSLHEQHGSHIRLSSLDSTEKHSAHILQEVISLIMFIKGQAGKLNFFGTRPNWAVSYIAYTKFHFPRPFFHSPSQIFTHIGERASASFPAWGHIYTYTVRASMSESVSAPSVWNGQSPTRPIRLDFGLS